MTENAKTTFLEEIKRDWNCGKSTSKTQTVALDQALKCLEKAVLLMICGSGWVQARERMLRSDVATGFLQLLLEKPIWEGVWPPLGPAG